MIKEIIKFHVSEFFPPYIGIWGICLKQKMNEKLLLIFKYFKKLPIAMVIYVKYKKELKRKWSQNCARARVASFLLQWLRNNFGQKAIRIMKILLNIEL